MAANVPAAVHKRTGDPDQPAMQVPLADVSESVIGQTALPSLLLAHWLRVHGLAIDDDHWPLDWQRRVGVDDDE